MVSGAKSSLRWFCLHPTTYPVCSAKQLIVESEDAEYVGEGGECERFPSCSSSTVGTVAATGTP